MMVYAGGFGNGFFSRFANQSDMPQTSRETMAADSPYDLTTRQRA